MGWIGKALRVTAESFAQVCKMRCQKVNANKSEVMVLKREKGWKCEVSVNGRQPEFNLI